MRTSPTAPSGVNVRTDLYGVSWAIECCPPVEKIISKQARNGTTIATALRQVNTGSGREPVASKGGRIPSLLCFKPMCNWGTPLADCCDILFKERIWSSLGKLANSGEADRRESD